MSDSGHNGSSFDVVVVAASYGGIEASISLLGALPREFPAPILLVQHRHPDSDYLAAILERRIDLPVQIPEAGVVPAPGTVYVLPAEGQGVLDGAGRFAFEAASRCCADLLLDSCARRYAERAVAVILTGRLEDGALGVRAVKRHGGRVLAQDRATADAFSMPAAAIATGCVDHVLPLKYIAKALVSLLMVPGAADLFAVRLHSSATM